MQIQNLENQNRKIIENKGGFGIMQYERDLSVRPDQAMPEYFRSKMNICRRQAVIQMDGSFGVTLQAGAMQWMGGSIQMKSGVKGVGDFFGKLVKSAVTNEGPIKPEYQGEGILVLEPTYKYLILEDIGAWGSQGMVMEDGMFVACQSNLQQKVVARKSISSAVLGGEGLFNLSLVGDGIAVLESNVPREELIEINLQDDELKIDGNLAVCWSGGLDFTVEASSKNIIGAAASGEGMVNVYRGTGKVLMAPVAPTDILEAVAQQPTHENQN